MMHAISLLYVGLFRSSISPYVSFISCVFIGICFVMWNFKCTCMKLFKIFSYSFLFSVETVVILFFWVLRIRNLYLHCFQSVIFVAKYYFLSVVLVIKKMTYILLYICFLFHQCSPLIKIISFTFLDLIYLFLCICILTSKTRVSVFRMLQI